MRKRKYGTKIATCTSNGVTFTEQTSSTGRHTYPVTSIIKPEKRRYYKEQERERVNSTGARSNDTEWLTHMKVRQKILFLQHTTLIQPK